MTQELHTITLIRHAESVKTLRDTHGGSGLPLTPTGREDCPRVAVAIREAPDFTVSGSRLVCGTSPQALETGRLVADYLQISFVAEADLRGIHMGIFDGKTDEEVWNLDPLAAARLKAWRDGTLDVEAIKIPGAENLQAFRARVADAVTRAALPGIRHLIVVVTRSVGIAILNMLLVPGSEGEGKYLRYRLDPGSITLMHRDCSGAWLLATLNGLGHLGRVTEYPDT